MPEGKALDKSVKVWVTTTEKEKIAELAEVAGVSLSQYCRGKIFDPVPLYCANPRELIQMVNSLSAEINPIGNNINQLARHANAAAKAGTIREPILNELNRQLGQFIARQTIIADAFLKFLRSKK